MTKTMLLLDVQNGEITKVEVDGLEDYYKHIGCYTIDIVSRKIGGKYYDIIADDEALLKGNFTLSAISSIGEPMLVNNLLIAGLADEEGEMQSLTEEDLKHIQNHIIPELCLLECEY